MKKRLPENLEQYRVDHPLYVESHRGSIEGCFIIPVGVAPMPKKKLTVMSGCGEGWDHVSVSLRHRCPTWDEMCAIKDMFWDKEELVLQYHPPESKYVNLHNNVLHMWKPWEVEIKLPPLQFV